MFKKVELWAVGVLCLVGFSAVVLASAMARLTAGGDERFGANDVVIYDFARDETSSPYLPSLRALDVRTPFEGRSKVLPDGDVIVEETEAGRILRLSREGTVRWRFINRASDGRIYLLNWSRHLTGEAGAQLVRKLESIDCAER